MTSGIRQEHGWVEAGITQALSDWLLGLALHPPGVSHRPTGGVSHAKLFSKLGFRPGEGRDTCLI